MAEDKADRDVLLAQRVDPSADQRVADALSLMAGRDGYRRQAGAGKRNAVGLDIHTAEQHVPNDHADTFGDKRHQRVAVRNNHPPPSAVTPTTEPGPAEGGVTDADDTRCTTHTCGMDITAERHVDIP